MKKLLFLTATLITGCGNADLSIVGPDSSVANKCVNFSLVANSASSVPASVKSAVKMSNYSILLDDRPLAAGASAKPFTVAAKQTSSAGFFEGANCDPKMALAGKYMKIPESVKSDAKPTLNFSYMGTAGNHSITTVVIELSSGQPPLTNRDSFFASKALSLTPPPAPPVVVTPVKVVDPAPVIVSSGTIGVLGGSYGSAGLTAAPNLGGYSQSAVPAYATAVPAAQQVPASSVSAPVVSAPVVSAPVDPSLTTASPGTATYSAVAPVAQQVAAADSVTPVLNPGSSAASDTAAPTAQVYSSYVGGTVPSTTTSGMMVARIGTVPAAAVTYPVLAGNWVNEVGTQITVTQSASAMTFTFQGNSYAASFTSTTTVTFASNPKSEIPMRKLFSFAHYPSVFGFVNGKKASVRLFSSIPPSAPKFLS